mgnify:CR=1 FL=1
MRIISGKFRGKKINYINSELTRPLRDFVKENIFNILTHWNNNKINIGQSNILDLYAGIGSFGIECLSRNANKVVFIEKDKTAFLILKKNIEKLNLTKKAELLNIDIKSYINKKVKEKFSIVFLDPPYKDHSFVEIIKLLKKEKILNDPHIIIIHREKKSEDDLQDYLNIQLVKQYGRSKVLFGTF